MFRLLTATALAVSLGSAPAPMLADDAPQSYLFTLSSSEPNVAGSALHLARMFSSKGRDVTILVLQDGLDLVLPGDDGGVFAGYGETPRTMLGMAMEAGAEVYACQICLKVRGVTADQLTPGIEAVNAYQVLDEMDAADKLLNF